MTKPTFKEFTVRHIAKGGAAYAINMDDGEECFINSTLAAKFEIDVGDEIKVLVVPNEKSDDVQWYAQILTVYE